MKKLQMWCQYYESNQNNAEGNTELADIGRSNSLKLFILTLKTWSSGPGLGQGYKRSNPPKGVADKS